LRDIYLVDDKRRRNARYEQAENSVDATPTMC
jgi:hypothetical protein